jgi:hypothetical protein
MAALKVSDMIESLRVHRRELAESEATTFRLRTLVRSEENWLKSQGHEVEPYRTRARGLLTDAIDKALTRALTVNEICERLTKSGYVPARSGRHFTKVVRMILYRNPELWTYDEGAGTWSRKSG